MTVRVLRALARADSIAMSLSLVKSRGAGMRFVLRGGEWQLLSPEPSMKRGDGARVEGYEEENSVTVAVPLLCCESWRAWVVVRDADVEGREGVELGRRGSHL